MTNALFLRALGVVSVMLALATSGCARRTVVYVQEPASQTTVSGAGGEAGYGASSGATGALPPPNEPMPERSVGTDVVATTGTPVTVVVDSRADIFSSSRDVASPERGGVLPSRITLPAGASAVEVSAVGGLVGCNASEPSAGPAGGACAGGSTDIQSADGISGIRHGQATQFLVGVFLRGAPGPTAPQRLDVTPGRPGAEQSAQPALGQTFYVGEGGRAITVPEGASELYLGICDGWSFHGDPAYYGDNTGAFRATVTVR